jgi:hypothetical protein
MEEMNVKDLQQDQLLTFSINGYTVSGYYRSCNEEELTISILVTEDHTSLYEENEIAEIEFDYLILVENPPINVDEDDFLILAKNPTIYMEDEDGHIFPTEDDTYLK